MSIVPAEKKEELKYYIGRVLSMSPGISVVQLKNRLAEMSTPVHISREYLSELVREVRQDRLDRLNRETKEDIYAQIESLVETVSDMLRAIAQEEKLVYTKTRDGKPAEKAETRIFAQNNRIKALNAVVDHAMKLVQLRMDLGLVERNLGSFNVNLGSLMSGLRKVRNGDYSQPIEALPVRA